MNCIELNNITKTYTGKTAVNQLSLAIPQGSIYGFIGPNGSGKTTTLRMILNIIYPDSGTIAVFEKAIALPIASVLVTCQKSAASTRR